MTLTPELLSSARTFLFVPGDRPDRFGKAADSGADVVIVDLEDAVAPGNKDKARRDAAAWFAAGAHAVLRINGRGTPWHDEDLRLLTTYGCPVMEPKAEGPGLAERLGGGVPLLPLIETAWGVERALEVCRAPGVVRAAFGSVDLATELGVRHEDTLALAHARSRLVLACAAAGIAAPIDGVTTALDDPEALERDIRHGKRLGYSGKLCVHPRQLPAVAAGFAPTREERDWARAVLTAGESATAVDGMMVDRPVRERARRLLGASGGVRPVPPA
ncbi:HpcH/HpaI aldolase/citrate lyase family protein [Streptomyces sp. NPDC001255]|uniref:HpcH/HpaI aldolase/citrate lyase family protein n=1 Tax=Streptomyces sp. NPDC001255 TaxID=3364550 RepID=UPI003687CEDF